MEMAAAATLVGNTLSLGQFPVRNVSILISPPAHQLRKHQISKEQKKSSEKLARNLKLAGQLNGQIRASCGVNEYVCLTYVTGTTAPGKPRVQALCP